MTTELNALLDTGEDVEGPVLPGAGGQQPHQPAPHRRRDAAAEDVAEPRRTTATSTPRRRASPARAAAICKSRRPPWRSSAGSRRTARPSSPQPVQKAVEVDRPAARRLRRLRLDAIDDPGAQGADRLRQGQQEDAGGRRTDALRRRQASGRQRPSRPARRSPDAELADAEKTSSRARTRSASR